MRLRGILDRLGRETELNGGFTFSLFLDAEGDLTLTGKCKVSEYEPTEISVLFRDRRVRIEGNRLSIAERRPGVLAVKGDICGIAWEGGDFL